MTTTANRHNLLIALLALGTACGGGGGGGIADAGGGTGGRLTDAGSGGSSSGGSGGGGTSGTGGSGTGGSGTGGSSMDGAAGGTGGTTSVPPDAGQKDASTDSPSSSMTLDTCFAGLPPPEMLATKRSADGKVRVRVALDTAGMIGTSGTKPWSLIRLGVEINGVVTCVTDKSKLTYLGHHHNCGDGAFATDGNVRFDFAALDRSSAQMTVTQGGTVTLGPVTVTDTSCVQMSGGFVLPGCRSGGPC